MGRWMWMLIGNAGRQKGETIEWLDPEDAFISFWNSMFPCFSLSEFSTTLEVDDLSLENL